jgi:SAM-dependent methyltransferase
MYLLDRLQEVKKENLVILEVGCGYGFMAEYLARLGNNVIGIDTDPVIPMSKKSLKDWRFKLIRLISPRKHFCFIHGNALELMDNWEDNSVDIVIDQCAVHSFNPLINSSYNISNGFVTFYSKAFRILKSEGMLIQATDVILNTSSVEMGSEFATELDLINLCIKFGFTVVDSSLMENAPFFEASNGLGIMTMTVRKP